MSLYNTFNLLGLTALVSIMVTIAIMNYLKFLKEEMGTTNLLEIYKIRKQKEARLNAIRHKYRKEITSAFPPLFHRATSKLDFTASSASSVKKVESNVIFVDFKNKKHKAS